MRTLIFLTLMLMAPIVIGETYTASKISHIYAHASGRVLLKWSGSPNPSSCGGVNHGWASLPSSSSEIIKALALSTYFAEKAVRIDTLGCDGPYEIIVQLYSPGG